MVLEALELLLYLNLISAPSEGALLTWEVKLILQTFT